MPKYCISYEQSYFASITVDADSEEEAIGMVDDAPEKHYWDWNPSEEIKVSEIEEL